MLGENATLLIVAAVLALGIVLNNIMARKERATGGSSSAGDLRELLSKFVHHNGSVVGETVSVEGDRLIIKQAGQFKAVPLAQAAVVDDEVQLTGDINWEDASASGTAWHTGNTAGADDAIAANLTRSEDVRSPALQAMKERIGDEEE